MSFRRAAPIGLLLLWTFATAAHAEAPRKFALAVFHFNLQYVAGGLVGFLPSAEPLGFWELDEVAVEDQIVRESFEPVLDLFLAHPSWGADIELQGRFVEVLAERHPVVLEKLRRLATAGQIAVVSFQYSDQLFLAFPSEEWRRSQALTRAIFDAHGVPLARSVFTQEGQSGVGMARAMAERGYDLMIWPTNLWGYQHGDGAVAPHYRFDGRDDVSLIVGGRGVRYDGPGGPIEVTWTFLDDGELLATGGIDPYFPPVFVHQPDAVAAYQRELAALETQGYAVTTTERYAAALRELGVPRAEPPPLLDGTWQPQSTDGIKRWLGGLGLWVGAERDNQVRTLQALAHRELTAAETAATAAGLDASGGMDARVALDGAWRLLALSQVSDSSGINPYRGEIEYGIAHATEALRIARGVILDAKAALGARGAVSIDTVAGTVEAAGAALAPVEVAAPLDLEIEATGRSVATSWTEEASGAKRVSVRFGAVTGGSERSLRVRFPGALGDIVYSPGLAEDRVVSLPRAAFEWDHFHLALANGLIGLGPGRFAIKDQATVHVAATVRRDRGGVAFQDDTAPPGESVTWSFLVADGSAEQALGVANRLNVTPTLVR